MKRFSTILMALVLALGLTQCKKNETTTTTTTTIDTPTEGVAITLRVQGNQGGTKADVNPTTGSVDYAIGDQVHVASAGKYVGTLTYDGHVFAGSISNAVEGQPLQFYFLGNVTPDEELTSGVTESCSVVITDQTEHLPVISAAPSVENYSGLNPDYTARLLNKCALVKFNVTTISNGATSLIGFNNKVTVNFMENTFDYGMANNGTITMPAGNGERWAILLPQAAMEAGDEGSVSSNSINGEYWGTHGAVPAIYANAFFTTGIPVEVSFLFSVGGLFSVSDNLQVRFSKGNLQYQASTNTWRFAESQYIVLGNENNGISSTYNGWIDLFGWATSGYEHGAVCYQPWSTSGDKQEYLAYGRVGYNLNDETGKADWGYNAISNGGNMENLWRTPTHEEWSYVFLTRVTESGIRFAKGIVNGVKGVILLPDNWNASLYALNNANGGSGVNCNVNIISADTWTNIFEPNGAVFMPFARARRYSSVTDEDFGGYHSATYRDDDHDWTVDFQIDGYGFSANNGYGWRSDGRFVRLVRNAE